MMHPLRWIALAALVSLLVGGPARGENWPGWRGPDRNGVSSEPDVPVRWSRDDGVHWKVPTVGAGISSPIIWGDRVVLTGSSGADFAGLHIVCHAVEDGRELWKLRFFGTAPTRCHGQKSTMASPTPVTDGRHVLAFFGTGDVFCVDLDGRLLWQRSLATEYGAFQNRFAASSSPLLHNGLVLLQCDHFGDSYAMAVDVASGTNRWKVARPRTWLSWSSPQLVTVEGSDRRELILCAAKTVDALDPLTGEALWTVQGMRRECIPTPVLGHGLIFAVSGPRGPSMAIRPGGRGDVTATHVVWRNQRGSPYVPSGILVGDHYFLVTDKGIGTCLDAHTGESVWQKRLPGPHTASPVAAGERVYFTSEDGTTTVIDATAAEYREVARNTIDEPVFASAAISGGRLFLRTAASLWCIDGTKN